MDVLVVGAGTMGRWFARTVGAEGEGDRKDNGKGKGERVAEGQGETEGQEEAEFDVAFADVDPAVAERAAGTVGGRAVDLDGDERFEAVCVAVPISAAETAVATQVPRATEAILDVTGIMSPVVEAMGEYAPDLERVSLHPLFAPENGPGNVAVVADAPGPVSDEVRDALVAGGNHLFETTPATHDRAMETVQARAHAAVLAFGLAAEAVPEEFQTAVSGPLRELVDQVTGPNPGVYAEIQGAFDGADDVAEAARRIADADREAFEALYREAATSNAGPSDVDTSKAASSNADTSDAAPSNAALSDDAASDDDGGEGAPSAGGDDR